MKISSTTTECTPTIKPDHNHFRFHLAHFHLNSVFGDDWFSLKAESFARFFGTPLFIVTQTIAVAILVITAV
jgi:hypothetical protein